MQLKFYPAAFESTIAPTINIVAILYAATIIVDAISSGHGKLYIYLEIGPNPFYNN